MDVPKVVQFSSALANRPAPELDLPSTKAERFKLSQLRGWRRSVLFFAHDHTCRVCQRYVRQLVKVRPEWDSMETRLVTILQDDVDRARHWGDEFAGGSEVLANHDGSAKRLFTSYVAAPTAARAEGTLVLLLDRFTAPRVGSYAPDSGGLISPHEITSWLQLLDFECDE